MVAQRIWNEALPCKVHQYLELKNVKSYGLRMKADGTLIIPCFDENNTLINLEQIFWNKNTKRYDKRPLKGGRRTGAFYSIGNQDKPEIIYISEGYSTGATIHEITQCLTYISFNCGNLPSVTQIIRKKFPNIKIMITADHDTNSAGEKFAKKAINDDANAAYILPDFSEIEPNIKPEIKRSDFNDLFSLLISKGTQEVAIYQIKDQLTYKLLLHTEILEKLLNKIIPVDFRKVAQLTDDEKLRNNHFQIIAIEEILTLAKNNDWGICRNHDFIYLYNGAYWHLIEEEILKTFLGKSAEKMGVDPFKAKHFNFRDQLFNQFIALGNLPKPKQPKNQVLINLLNGTFKITPDEVRLQSFNRSDFITYQLPFEYAPHATAPLFNTYLNKVLPNLQLQNILSEYLGYIFIAPSTLKLEKTLLLYGKGANGKSVFYEIVRNIFGEQNTSEFSLQSLTDTTGYFRAMLANKLVNYASELNGKLETSIFKQLTSGEPVEARCPYGVPFIMSNYAKLIFNCNELPKDVEQTEAYFRRFLIVPFEITISESEQDPQLAQKIITQELSGIFNWVLDGLQRLLSQKRFTDCDVVKAARNQYETESDSVRLFLQEVGYNSSPSNYISMKILYEEYRNFCSEDGFKPVNKTNFKKRLESVKIIIERKNFGEVAFVEKV